MTSTFEIELGRSALGLRWPDGNRRDYPYIWLRDSDPAAFHPDTKERTGDLLEHPRETPSPRPPGCRGGLQIAWQDGAVSRFDLEWLEGHGPGRRPRSGRPAARDLARRFRRAPP
jgi:DUF971 family protein